MADLNFEIKLEINKNWWIHCGILILYWRIYYGMLILYIHVLVLMATLHGGEKHWHFGQNTVSISPWLQ